MINYKQLWKEIIGTVRPINCSGCGSFIDNELDVFCTVCLGLLEPIAPFDIKVHHKHIISVYAASSYKPPVRNLILAKSRSDIVASKRLAYLIWQRTIVSGLDFDCIVPVPLHWMRYARRGYNQAEVIGRYLSKFSYKPLLLCMARTRNTQFQSKFDAQGRLENIKGSFKIEYNYRAEIHNKKVLIVDDLMTTGITLKEMGSLLYKNNALVVSAAVAARVT